MARARREERLGLGDPVGFPEETGEVVEVGGDGRMVGAVAGLGDGEGAAEERLGLGEPVGGLEEIGEVVEARGEHRMLRAVAGLGDGESAAEERLGLGEPVGGLEETGEVVKVGGDGRDGRRRSWARRWRGRGGGAARPRRAGWWPGGDRRGC